MLIRSWSLSEVMVMQFDLTYMKVVSVSVVAYKLAA